MPARARRCRGPGGDRRDAASDGVVHRVAVRAVERPHARAGAQRDRAGHALTQPYTTRWGPATLAIVAGAALLRAIAGVGFVNYDTLYGLVWGAQLTRGETPEYGLPIAPTPHPLIEVLGIPLAPLGASAESTIVVALAFLALSACGWVLYRLGEAWFGRAAGIVAALVFLTRVPVLSYGVRAYVDIPYTLLVLSALLVETRRRLAGAPVLVLLGLAGLLRPEAWLLAGIYWLVLVVYSERTRRNPEHDVPGPAGDPAHAQEDTERTPPRSRRDLAWLGLLAAAAHLFWIVSDLVVTGNAMWSLTNTKHTAATLGRATGIGDVPQYIPRRIGEILRPAVLAGAAVGGVLSLLWLRHRSLLGAIAGAVAVLVFALDGELRAADRHALRVPHLGHPLPVLRRRRVRLDRVGQGRPSACSLDGRRGPRAPRARGDLARTGPIGPQAAC